MSGNLVILVAIVVGSLFLLPLVALVEALLTMKGGRKVGLILPVTFAAAALVVSKELAWQLFGGAALVPGMVLLGFCCVPAAVLLAVYLVCLHMEKKKAVDELRKMEMQDLQDL